MKNYGFIALTVGMFLGGCGPELSGVYTGNETLVMNGNSDQCSVTVSLNESSEDALSGTFTSCHGTGSITGTKLSGSDAYNATLSLNSTVSPQPLINNSPYGMGSASSGFSNQTQSGFTSIPGQTCGTVSFKGQLNFSQSNQNRITGSLVNSETQPQSNTTTTDGTTIGSPYMGSNYSCSGSMTIDAGK